MACRRISDLKPGFIHVMRAVLEQLAREFHLVVEQERIDRIAVNLLETHFELLENNKTYARLVDLQFTTDIMPIAS